MMSVKDFGKQSEITSATKEARELYRIRNSFTFNLGIQLVRSVKNPLLLPILPFRILKLLFSKKTTATNPSKIPRGGYLIIGVDRIGDYHSSQAELISKLVSNSNLGEVTLINNSTVSNVKPNGLEWYRIPPVREKNKSRKEWNIMAERVISTAMSISQPQHIIYFGDYLYRGVVDALSPFVEAPVAMTWFLPHTGFTKQMKNTKLTKMVPILLPEFSTSPPTSQSVHRILRRSESENLLLLDVAPQNEHLLKTIIRNNEQIIVTAIQREHSLPKEIDYVVRMKEVIGMQLEGRIRVVIDDQSPLVSSLSMIQAPTLLLRTGHTLSPIIDKMIRQLELEGRLIVVRRTTPEELIHSLKYLSQLQSYTESNQGRAQFSGPSLLTDYVISWLRKPDQSYS